MIEKKLSKYYTKKIKLQQLRDKRKFANSTNFKDQIRLINKMINDLKSLIKNPTNLNFYNKQFNCIKRAICFFFNVSIETFNIKSNKREISQIRFLGMYFAKKYIPNATLRLIAFKIGNLDHSMVPYAVKTINNLYETDKQFKNEFDRLSKLIEYRLKNINFIKNG